MAELKTPLTDWHVAHGAKMAPFAGWLMPIQYEGILVEHQHTRQHAGLFDICHMGEFRIRGAGADAALAAAVAAIVLRMVRNKKKGCSSCGCGCGNCAMSGSCHPKD